MAVDIIDLISSDDEVPVVASPNKRQLPGVTNSATGSSKVSTLGKKTPSLTQQPTSVKVSSQWTDLLSDSDHPSDAVPSSSYELPSAKNIKATTILGKTKGVDDTKATSAQSPSVNPMARQSPSNKQSRPFADSFPDLSDDFDVFAPLPIKMTTKPHERPTRKTPVFSDCPDLASSPPKVQGTTSRAQLESFIELSDDLDVFAPLDLPTQNPRKRQRLTPVEEQDHPRFEDQGVEVVQLDMSDDNPPGQSAVVNKDRLCREQPGVTRAPTITSTRTNTRTFRRAVSTLDDISSSNDRPLLQKRAGNGLKRSRTITGDSDPIIWSSSPVQSRNKENQRAFVCNRKEKGSNGQAANGRAKHDFLSGDESEELPDLGEVFSLSQAELQVKVSTYKSVSRPTTSAPISPKSKKTVDKEAAKEATRLRREQATREKQAAKDAAQAQKRQTKAERELEKQKAATLAKLNTLRTDKKVATPEMIVDIPQDLQPTLIEQIKEFLKPLQVEHRTRPSLMPKVVKWRRKVVSRYNEELDIWQPTGAHISDENFALCIMQAQEFVDLATSSQQEDESSGSEKGLDFHVLQMRTKFEGCSLIYLIEGLNAWMRKNRNVRNRAFTEAVRTQGQEPEPTASQSQSRRKKKTAVYIDEDMVEDALLKLQIEHGVKIHHTSAMIETAEWVIAFTQHIATVPYRTNRSTLANSFCMESGQVKTGATPADTYVRMLEEIARITAPIAHAITAEYPTLPELVRGLRANGPDALEGCRKSANKDGAFTDRRIGKAISRRVWRIFMSTDEASVDV